MSSYAYLKATYSHVVFFTLILHPCKNNCNALTIWLKVCFRFWRVKCLLIPHLFQKLSVFLTCLLFQLKFWNHLVMLQITYVCYIYKQILEELFLCEQILKTQICFKMTTVWKIVERILSSVTTNSVRCYFPTTRHLCSMCQEKTKCFYHCFISIWFCWQKKQRERNTHGGKHATCVPENSFITYLKLLPSFSGLWLTNFNARNLPFKKSPHY